MDPGPSNGRFFWDCRGPTSPRRNARLRSGSPRDGARPGRESSLRARAGNPLPTRCEFSVAGGSDGPGSPSRRSRPGRQATCAIRQSRPAASGCARKDRSRTAPDSRPGRRTRLARPPHGGKAACACGNQPATTFPEVRHASNPTARRFPYSPWTDGVASGININPVQASLRFFALAAGCAVIFRGQFSVFQPVAAAAVVDARRLPPPADRMVEHWAFKSPIRPDLPEPKNKKWLRSPVDHFVLARLEKEGLKPSPEADKVTLLRRVSLDLIGLPPTIAESDAFLADRSSDAYEKQVERLLNSPHYGERWGRHWLDAARYADSDGFEKDKPRFIWSYRDWVINAFNRDLPYDRFIIEQIAGDQLSRDANSDSQEAVLATGFLRNAMLNEEGGVDPEQFRMEAMADRMDCIGKSVLGLTIQCAQCHNHKYDPLKQEEYYRLFAFLNNDHEASMVTCTTGERMRMANLTREMRDIEAGLRHTTPDWQERMNLWEDSIQNNQPQWTVVRAVNAGDNGERYYYYDDGSIRAASYAPTKWTAHFRGTNNLPFIGAFQLEQLTDPNLPDNGPGRSIKGMSALSEFKVEAVDLQDPTNKVEVKFVKATADYSNPEKELEPEFYDKSDKKRIYGPVEFAIDGKDDTAWGIDAGPGRRNQPRKAVFLPEKPLIFTKGVVLNFRLMQNHGGWNSDDNQNHNLGRFRLSVPRATHVVADPGPAT